jgi:large subunit ribosomal protein L9
MQVILLERIEKLGQMGDVVSVKPGYARNYLLPQRKARRATKENLALFEKHRAQLEAENLTRRDEAQKVGEKLDGLAVTLIRQAGESGQLYGSVTSRDLAEAATAAGFTVARTQILLDMVIKTLGLHTIRVRLHPEVTVTVTANVARSDAEAEAQAKSGHIVSAEEREAVAAAAASAKEAALSALEADEAEADEADAGEAEDSAKGE